MICPFQKIWSIPLDHLDELNSTWDADLSLFFKSLQKLVVHIKEIVFAVPNTPRVN